MRLKEFEEKVGNLGLKIVRRPGQIIVADDGEIEWVIASISSEKVCKVDTENYYGNMIPEGVFRQLFHLLVKFSQTSVEER